MGGGLKKGICAALMYVNEDATRSVIFVYGLARNDHRDFPAPIPVRGLSEKRRYGIRELNMVNGKNAQSGGRYCGRRRGDDGDGASRQAIRRL